MGGIFIALVLRSCPGVLVPVEPEATDILPVFQPFRKGSRLRPTAESCSRPPASALGATLR